MPQKLINFGQLFSRVRKKIFYVELRVVLAHKNGESSAVASPRKP
jgi:hypothetical protein